MAFRTVALSIAAFLVAPATFGQATKPEPEPRYDPATSVDVMATVAEVREAPRGSPLSGVHLVVKTEKETIEVYVAPAGFLKEMGLQFAAGDRLQIVGSRVKLGAGFIILAREVRRDSSTLYLRDQRGSPNWAAEKPRT